MGFLSCNPNITSVEKLKSQIIFNGKNQYKVAELFSVSGFDVKNICQIINTYLVSQIDYINFR